MPASNRNNTAAPSQIGHLRFTIDDLRAEGTGACEWQMAHREWPRQRRHRPFVPKPLLSAFCILPATFISVAGRLQQVRLVCGHAAEGVAGADFGDRALITVHAAVMPHLQEERAIAEAVAAFDALGATDAKPLDRKSVV
jgi:hypothetical protein